MAVTHADLTGRASGYRDIAIRCPGCAAPMRQLSLEKAEAEVDVCDGCGGLWVDWFDGELRAIATETQSVRSPADVDAGAREENEKDEQNERPSTNEGPALGACPRCTRHLVSERYTIQAEVQSARIEGRTSLVGGTTGAELLRCEDCMGSFVSRTSAEVLSWLGTSDESPPMSHAPPSHSEGVLEPLPWDRFVALLKRLLGLEKTAAAPTKTR
jgi:Zn-finger nucleic acid-binding protein